MSNQRLPHQILENIFRFTIDITYNKPDLTKCALVCQAWHLPACRVLYVEVEVEKLDRMLNCLTIQKLNKGVYCKVLTFNKPSKKIITRERFTKLLAYLPNLRKFVMSQPDCTYDLKQLARNADLIPNVNKILLERGGVIPQESQAYHECAITFKDSLQIMKLISPHRTVFAPDGRAENKLSFLPEFACLTKLEIENPKHSYGQSLPNLRMFSILRTYPNLINFRLNNGYQEPEDDYNHPFDHSKLRYLDLTIPEITENQINYMAQNKTGLDHLKGRSGNCNETAQTHWFKKIGPDYLNQLQKYLANIEKVDFVFGIYFKLDTTEAWPFMRGVVNNKCLTPTHVSMMVMDRLTCDEKRMLLEKR